MKKFILLLIALPLLSHGNMDEYKNACEQIGFKPNTEDFGECVLKLRKKSLSKEKARAGNSASSQNYENNNKQKTSNTNDIEQLKQEHQRIAEQQFEAIERQNELLRQQYETQLAMFDQQTKQIEAEEARRKKARALKQIEMGLRMASGQSVTDAAIATAGMQPLPRPTPPRFSPMEQYRITLPNGSLFNCSYDPNIRRANCY